MVGKTLFSTLALIVAAASSVSALVTPVIADDALVERQLPTRSFDHAGGSNVRKHETNAQRIARGLPVSAPKQLWKPSRVVRQAPSALPPVNYRAMLAVVDATSSALYGYVSKNSISSALLGYDSAIDNALIVDFTLPGGETTETEVEFTMENFDLSRPILGLTPINNARTDNGPDINSGSSSYGVFTGSGSTPGGSTPTYSGNTYSDATTDDYDSETSIWTVDTAALTVTPQWINTDGSAPATYLLAYNGEMLFTGDPQKYRSAARNLAATVNIRLVLL